MPLYLIYPAYTFVILIVLFIVVPQKRIRDLVIFSLFFGGVGDLSAIFLFTKLFGIGGYINYGPFGMWGIPFFPIVAWTCFFILFFYLIPEQKVYRYFYIVISSAFCTFFSFILQNLKIFRWNVKGILIPFLIYITWLAATAWIYRRIEKI